VDVSVHQAPKTLHLQTPLRSVDTCVLPENQ